MSRKIKPMSFGYKVNRTKTSHGMLYTVRHDNGVTVDIVKRDRFFKPVGRHYRYCSTLRDAIFQTIM